MKNQSNQKMKCALIVLGMHRSGTSALTGVLNSLGVELGKELYAPQKGVNERGFWEHSDIVDAHDEIFSLIGSSWDDLLPLPHNWHELEVLKPVYKRLTYYVKRDFSQSIMWGLKDPRMSILLPIWKKIFKELDIQPHFLIIFRHPSEVAKSLEARNSFPKEKSAHLWISHNISSEFHTRGGQRTFVAFDDLMSDTENTFLSVEDRLDINFPINVRTAAKEFNEFISPSLRHHKSNSISASSEIELIAEDLFTILQESTINSNLHNRFDQISTRFIANINKVPYYWHQHLRSTGLREGKHKLLYYKVYNSLSWRLVKPIWWIEKLFKDK